MHAGRVGGARHARAIGLDDVATERFLFTRPNECATIGVAVIHNDKPTSEPTNAASSRSGLPKPDYFWPGWSAALALGTAIITVHPEFETDPFWHLTLGRSVLEHKSRTVPEPTAFAAFSDPAVVPEWLWSVTMLGFGQPGSTTAAAFVFILAITSVFAGALLLRTAAKDLSRGAFAFLSAGISVLLLLRMRLRPEAAALVLLPVFMVLAYRYADVEERARKRLGMALIGIEILWAQLHGSFVLAPPIFLILGAKSAWFDRKNHSERNVHGAVFGALVVGLFTSAYGLDLYGYLSAHAGGDALRHITDFGALRWQDFAPETWLDGPYGGPYAPVLFIMAGMAVFGMFAARSFFWTELALAVLGVVLMTKGCRFMTMGAILGAPLAAKGAVALGSSLPPGRWSEVLGVLLGVAGVFLQGRGMHLARGPIGTTGLSEGNYPIAAAAYLKQLPGQSIAVLTTFDSGAPLGYWLRNKVRTYVDSRTPLYFDATDFAVSRDTFHDPITLHNVLRRYDIQAVVSSRNSAVCQTLAETWDPVVIEPRFTLFVPKNTGVPMTTLLPCGENYVPKDACQDTGIALDRDIARLENLVSRPFHAYLRAEWSLRCGGTVNGLSTLIPSRAIASTFEAQRDRVLAAWLLRVGRHEEAVQVLTPSIIRGDAQSYALAYRTISSEKFPVEVTRELLEDIVAAQDDRTPHSVRALLAVTCAEQDDVECARFHAFRAAAAGHVPVRPTLKWLLRAHPSARVRADAQMWLDLLATMTGPKSETNEFVPAPSAMPAPSASPASSTSHP